MQTCFQSPAELDLNALQGQTVTTASPAPWGTTVLPGPTTPRPARWEPLETAARWKQLESACRAPQTPSAPGLGRLAASPAGPLLSLHPLWGSTVSAFRKTPYLIVECSYLRKAATCERMGVPLAPRSQRDANLNRGTQTRDRGVTQVLAHCQLPVMDYRTSRSPGVSHCTCQGLNRVFQKSDGSCICQAGHEFSNKRGLESDESNGAEDCQAQVAKCCSPGDVRLATTRQCVFPQQHNCSSFCHPVGRELSAELGICQCREYVSAEELCDAQCLARAPQLSLAWGPNRQLILTGKGEDGDSVQRCGLHSIFGFVISGMDMLGSLLLGKQRGYQAQAFPERVDGAKAWLLSSRKGKAPSTAVPTFSPSEPLLGSGGPPVSSSQLQRRHRTADWERPVPQTPSIHPHIPNPVVCLVEGDAILFQLHIHPHMTSHTDYGFKKRVTGLCCRPALDLIDHFPRGLNSTSWSRCSSSNF
ncbi:hypothetical protein HPG69_017534 [Diceros bicornis minor]|uniref:Uncharacterized protein n=1 Tax=Diceros bicornis minor TaxID=77932 RepID=A0A7J7EKI9_DICBM|nr:hypothetical protein HPG69_017534 [Diceros bicornis minor]